MYIDGFGIAGYRSFGPDLQRIGPCEKINLFVGQNNSGKSNILLFLKEHYGNLLESILKSKGFLLGEFDRPRGRKAIPLSLALCVSMDGNAIKSAEETISDSRVWQTLQHVSKESHFTSERNLVWFLYTEEHGSKLRADYSTVNGEDWKSTITLEEHNDLWETVIQQASLTPKRKLSDDVYYWAEKFRLTSPTVSLIPAIRKISQGNLSDDDHSGLGLIERLAQLQNPAASQQDLKQRFNKINEFLREVVGNSSAQIEIPFDRNMILVHMDNRTLPLSSLEPVFMR